MQKDEITELDEKSFVHQSFSGQVPATRDISNQPEDLQENTQLDCDDYFSKF